MKIFNLFRFLEIQGENQTPDHDIEIWTNFPLYVQDMLLILIIIGSIITICLFVIIYYLKKLTNKEEKNICSNCNVENPKENKHCKNCGTALKG